MTWQVSLQYVGGAFVLVSLTVFAGMAIGRRPDYSRAFLGVWMLALPVSAGWIGCGFLFGLGALVNHPALLAAAVGVALIVFLKRHKWLLYWRRLRNSP